MRKIPNSVLIIASLYIIAGMVGLVYHATELGDSPDYETFWILLLRLLAVIGGIFVLRGANWARWMLVAWIAYHVGLSFYHSISEVLAHALLLALTVIALFNKKAATYFKGHGA